MFPEQTGEEVEENDDKDVPHQLLVGRGRLVDLLQKEPHQERETDEEDSLHDFEDTGEDQVFSYHLPHPVLEVLQGF